MVGSSIAPRYLKKHNISNVHHAERDVSFLLPTIGVHCLIPVLDSHGLYRRKGSTDVKGFILEGMEDGIRGSRSSTSSLMCTPARAEQKRRASTRHDTARYRLMGLDYCGSTVVVSSVLRPPSVLVTHYRIPYNTKKKKKKTGKTSNE